MPPMPVRSSKQSSSSSSFLCCTSERSGQATSYTTTSHSASTAYRSSTEQSSSGQSKFLWLDPTRWVEKRTVKKEKVGNGRRVLLREGGTVHK